VGIAHRRLVLPMTQELSDGLERLAAGDQDGRERMAKVMDAKTLQARVITHPPPGSIKVGQGGSLRRWEDESPQGRALHASLGEELETILSRLSVLLHDVRSVLRVGVPQALFHHFFPKILQDFRAEAEDIELAFYERDTALEKMMMEGALDAAVSERSFSHPAITHYLLGTYRLVLVWPAEWGIPEEGSDLSAFRDLPFITYETGQTVRERALEYLSRQMQTAPQVATSASGSTSVTRLIEAGLGYGVVPEWAAAEVSSKTMQRVLVGMDPMKIWFAHTAFLGNNAYVHVLHRCCRKVLGDAAQE
jgi:DNA-binding transcriptional LysR family regulator